MAQRLLSGGLDLADVRFPNGTDSQRFFERDDFEEAFG
jgi:hypothetical protein